MKIKIYQIDAFAAKVFEGNPAAVCPLDAWLPEETMQKVAMENNLAETAFFVKKGERYEIRWFTPTKEVDLCGHATLASAHLLFHLLGYAGDTILFDSRSGPLHVSRTGALLTLDFPAEPPVRCETPKAIVDAFGIKPAEVLKSVDYIVVFEGVDITRLQPDLQALKALELRGVCITSTDQHYDFVSRFFAPNFGIDEDSVTGSAHTQLMPYWAHRLKRATLKAKQVSPRGGELQCTLKGDRVLISGKAVLYLSGEIEV